MSFCKQSWFTTVIVLLWLEIQLARVSCEVEDNCTFQKKAGIGFMLIPTSLSPYKDDCETIVFKIQATSNSSIIKFTSSPYVINTNTTSTLVYPYTTEVNPTESQDTRSMKNIYIIFEEISLLHNGISSSVVMETWNLADHNFTMERIYLSRTPYLRVLVKMTGNWMEGVQLSYEELKFSVFSMTSNEGVGVVTASVFGEQVGYKFYRPHSAYIYQIKKSRGMNASSISMTLNYLDVDENLGEYLLIGSGDTPFHGPPALFLSNKSTKTKKYKINDENAYIIFVSTSTKGKHKGFSIKWRHDGTKITGIDDKKPIGKDDRLQSIQVCIYNYSAALTEFRKPNEEQFKNFREELSRIGSEVARNNFLPSISSSKISFYRISAIETHDKFHPEGLVYVMLKIEGSEKGKAAFNRALLQESFNLYNSSRETNHYKIGWCPTRKPVNSWFYAMIPILCCFLILIWIWKQKPFVDDYFKRKMLRKASIQFSQQLSRMSKAEENFYHSVPDIFVSDENGTQYYQDDNCNGEDSEFDPESTQSRTSSNLNLLNAEVSGNRNLTITAEINHGFEFDQEVSSTAVKSVLDIPIVYETENTYNSMTSSRTLDRKEIFDTKL